MSYTGICRGCDRRQRLLLKTGFVGRHKEPRQRAKATGREWCSGFEGPPRSGSECCGQCRAKVGQGAAHKMDCHAPRRLGRMDTR